MSVGSCQYILCFVSQYTAYIWQLVSMGHTLFDSVVLRDLIAVVSFSANNMLNTNLTYNLKL